MIQDNNIDKVNSNFKTIISNYIHDNKRMFLLLGIALILTIIIVVTILLFSYNYKDPYEKYLKDMGKEFYETFYYDQISSDVSDMTEFLKQYEKIGIKVNLNVLSKYAGQKNNELISKFVNSKTGNPCNYTDTRVIIYPHSPYDKKSYSIKTELSCNE